MTVRLIVVATTLLIACSRASSDPAPAPIPSTFQYAPQQGRYLQASHRTVTQDVSGLESSTTTTLRYIVTTVVDAGSPSSHLQFTIDSVIDVDGAEFDRRQAAAVRGAVFEGQLLPSGEVTGLHEGNANDPLMSRIQTTLSQFFPIIPDAGLRPGATWVDTTSSVRRTGRTQVQIDAIVESSAGDWEDVADGVTITITWRASYTLSGEGEQLGRRFTIRGSGVTTGHSHVSGEGMFLATFSSDSSSAEVVVEELGYEIPVLQSGTDTLTLMR